MISQVSVKQPTLKDMDKINQYQQNKTLKNANIVQYTWEVVYSNIDSLRLHNQGLWNSNVHIAVGGEMFVGDLKQ